MRVRLPEGSRTRKLATLIDGEKCVLLFDESGEATVPAGKEQAVLAAFPALKSTEKPKSKAKAWQPAEIPEEPVEEPVEAELNGDEENE